MSGADDTAMPMSEEHFLNGLEQEVSSLHEQKVAVQQFLATAAAWKWEPASLWQSALPTMPVDP